MLYLDLTSLCATFLYLFSSFSQHDRYCSLLSFSIFTYTCVRVRVCMWLLHAIRVFVGFFCFWCCFFFFFFFGLVRWCAGFDVDVWVANENTNRSIEWASNTHEVDADDDDDDDNGESSYRYMFGFFFLSVCLCACERECVGALLDKILDAAYSIPVTPMAGRCDYDTLVWRDNHIPHMHRWCSSVCVCMIKLVCVAAS